MTLASISATPEAGGQCRENAMMGTDSGILDQTAGGNETTRAAPGHPKSRSHSGQTRKTKRGVKKDHAVRPDVVTRWHIFAMRYAATLNLVGSYEAVYGTRSKKPSEQAARLLQIPEVAQLVAEEIRPTLERLGVTKDFTVRRLLEEIDADIFDYVRSDGSLMTLAEIKALPLSKRRLIVDMDLIEDGESGFRRRQWLESHEEGGSAPEAVYRAVARTIDKQKALATLARLQGWFGGSEQPAAFGTGFIQVLIEATARADAMMKDIRPVIDNSKSIKHLDRADPGL